MLNGKGGSYGNVVPQLSIAAGKRASPAPCLPVFPCGGGSSEAASPVRSAAPCLPAFPCGGGSSEAVSPVGAVAV